MAKEYKNDIFEVIKQIDRKNYNYYDSLTDEQKKEIQPYTLMRWMSTVSDEQSHQKYNITINNNVNKYFWELSKYKDLQFKLLCTSGQSGFNRHQWIPISKTLNDKTLNSIKEYFQGLTSQEIQMKYQKMSKEEIKDIQNFLGFNIK